MHIDEKRVKATFFHHVVAFAFFDKSTDKIVHDIYNYLFSTSPHHFTRKTTTDEEALC
jgi:hypothetical protein